MWKRTLATWESAVSNCVNVVHGNTLGTKQCFSRGEAVEGRIFFRLGVANGVLISSRQLLHWVTKLLHAVSLDETCVSMKIWEAVEGRIFFRLGVANGVLISSRQLLHWVTKLLHAVSLDETCVSMKICEQGCDLLDSGVFLIII